jgi:hypothetical protein
VDDRFPAARNAKNCIEKKGAKTRKQRENIEIFVINVAQGPQDPAKSPVL